MRDEKTERKGMQDQIYEIRVDQFSLILTLIAIGLTLSVCQLTSCPSSIAQQIAPNRVIDKKLSNPYVEYSQGIIGKVKIIKEKSVEVQIMDTTEVQLVTAIIQSAEQISIDDYVILQNYVFYNNGNWQNCIVAEKFNNFKDIQK